MKVNVLRKTTGAIVIYYSGRLLIIIMRPKASLTDCYAYDFELSQPLYKTV